jgi:hypothetical protein
MMKGMQTDTVAFRLEKFHGTEMIRRQIPGIKKCGMSLVLPENLSCI